MTSQHITSPPTHHGSTTSHHQNATTRQNGWGLVHTKNSVWASHWFVALRTFYRQFLSLACIFYPWNFCPRPRLARELLLSCATTTGMQDTTSLLGKLPKCKKLRVVVIGMSDGFRVINLRLRLRQWRTMGSPPPTESHTRHTMRRNSSDACMPGFLKGARFTKRLFDKWVAGDGPLLKRETCKYT